MRLGVGDHIKQCFLASSTIVKSNGANPLHHQRNRVYINFELKEPPQFSRESIVFVFNIVLRSGHADTAVKEKSNGKALTPHDQVWSSHWLYVQPSPT